MNTPLFGLSPFLSFVLSKYVHVRGGASECVLSVPRAFARLYVSVCLCVCVRGARQMAGLSSLGERRDLGERARVSITGSSCDGSCQWRAHHMALASELVCNLSRAWSHATPSPCTAREGLAHARAFIHAHTHIHLHTHVHTWTIILLNGAS